MAYTLWSTQNFAVFTNIAWSGKFRVKVLKGRTIGITNIFIAHPRVSQHTPSRSLVSSRPLRVPMTSPVKLARRKTGENVGKFEDSPVSKSVTPFPRVNFPALISFVFWHFTSLLFKTR